MPDARTLSPGQVLLAVVTVLNTFDRGRIECVALGSYLTAHTDDILHEIELAARRAAAEAQAPVTAETHEDDRIALTAIVVALGPEVELPACRIVGRGGAERYVLELTAGQYAALLESQPAGVSTETP